MKIITISREFGSGGREVGKRLADALDFDYYDSEIVSAVAEKCKLSASDSIEHALRNHGWHNFSLNYGHTMNSSFYLQSGKIDILFRQKEVIEEIAALGKDFVIIGRNSDVILKEYRPLNLFICADTQAKLQRCTERAREGEDVSPKALMRQMKEIDRNRARTRTLLTGTAWGKRDAYHLTVNTGGWCLKDLIPILSSYALAFFEKESCE